MKNRLLPLVLGMFSLIATGQIKTPKKPFDHLVTRQVKHHREASFSLDSLTAIIYNGKFEELDKKPAGFSATDFECEVGSVIIADVLLDKKAQRRALLTFGVCPEFEFYLYDRQTKGLIQSFSALNIVIDASGSLHTSGHLNEFDLKRKYSFNGKAFVEDKQPFYYVGLKSVTLNEVKIYGDKQLSKLIAVLPKGREIEVLIAEKPSSNKLYLVRTGFGVIGWAPLKVDQYKSVDVEGLFYNND
ncbi:MAG: hypothetical protein ICV83_16790 [Cytophagales bacterium]|nr:hypothetical protein [Cytophagales bacterium]